MPKRILFLILSTVLFCLAFLLAKPAESELMRAFVEPNSNIIKLSNIASQNLNIIIESKTLDGIEEIKSKFPKNNFDTKDILEIYKNYPENFLSERTKNLILEKNYKSLKKESLERVYNPLGFYISTPDKDPYLLATDFVLSLDRQEEVKKLGDNYYSIYRYKIKNNNDIEKFLSLQNSVKKGKIYLTGAPIHSYLTTRKSILEINIFCLISTLALILLCKYYFKNPKITIPIGLSILFGFLFGYSFTTLLFEKIHVLTFVFSTSLIGISLDYSLHYFLTGEEKEFRKNLTASMLTTVLAFLILLFSDIEVLKQISIFTSFGLLGVYLFVLTVLPMFKLKIKPQNLNFMKFNPIFEKTFLLFVFVVIILGNFNLKFNDNIKNLYVPQKSLLQSETLYQKVFNAKTPEFLIIEGENINEILEKEEKLNIKNSLNLSNFVSSKKIQEENINLVKTLYKENLSDYAKFLNAENIKQLKIKEMRIYDVEKFPLKSQFMLDEKTSYIMLSDKIAGSINPADELTKQLTKFRKKCLQLLPIVFVGLFLLLSILYKPLNALKIVISPLLGVIFAVGFLSILSQPINLFNILGLFLIIGFSLDYSIFRLNSGSKSEDAVLLSVISTAFSFFLLSFTSFKLISSLGITLFIGITSAYLLSLVCIKKTKLS